MWVWTAFGRALRTKPWKTTRAKQTRLLTVLRTNTRGRNHGGNQKTWASKPEEAERREILGQTSFSLTWFLLVGACLNPIPTSGIIHSLPASKNFRQALLSWRQLLAIFLKKKGKGAHFCRGEHCVLVLRHHTTSLHTAPESKMSVVTLASGGGSIWNGNSPIGSELTLFIAQLVIICTLCRVLTKLVSYIKRTLIRRYPPPPKLCSSTTPADGAVIFFPRSL